jgi:hypothetical protein
MNTKTLVLLTACLCTALAACGSSPAAPSSVSQTLAASPTPGDWTASTAFGTLVFTVNSASTHLTSVGLTFNGWRGRSGRVTVSTDNGWPIASRSFSVSFGVWSFNAPDDEWTIEGNFENSGTGASGSWQVRLGGTTQESGTWKATPNT